MKADTTLDRMVRAAPSEAPRPGSVQESTELMARLAETLLIYGLPAHRVEEALDRLARALDVGASFVAAPTSITLSVQGRGEQTGEQQTRVLRVHPGTQDLERLTALHELVGRVERRELGAAEASRRIGAILSQPPRYGLMRRLPAWALASFSAAVLLGGGIEEAAVAAALGLLVGGVVELCDRWPTAAQLAPVLAAGIASSLAFTIAAADLAPVRPMLAVVAAVVVLLPGLAATMGITELATGNLVSGTARILGATLTFLLLTFGIAIGQRFDAGASLAIDPESPARDFPVWATALAPGVTSLALVVLLRARPRDTGWIVLGGFAASIGAWAGVQLLGPALGGFGGALVAAAFAHVLGRILDRPIAITLVPSILTLVPGSLGFLSFSSLLRNDVPGAVETAFRMALVTVSIATGVLVATLAVPPRRPI